MVLLLGGGGQVDVPLCLTLPRASQINYNNLIKAKELASSRSSLATPTVAPFSSR